MKWKYILRLCNTIYTGIIYLPMLYIYYRGDVWRLYNSYKRNNAEWKKGIWNKYMRAHHASISIDAIFKGRPILPHGVSGIFITQNAVIGVNAVIFQQVTIGANTIQGSKSYGAPILGDNVYIGAGAKIIGSAKIGDNVRIGANAVVVNVIPNNSTVVCASTTIIAHNYTLNNTFSPYLK